MLLRKQTTSLGKSSLFGSLDQSVYVKALEQEENIAVALTQEAMHVDFFSGTFYAQRNDMKQQYKILTSDAADYYMESMFVLSVQVMLCTAIWCQPNFVEEAMTKYKNNYWINLCSFFTALVLHFGCIATVRNGLSMAKFVVFHSEQFKHPIHAFFLALCIMFANVFVATTNLFNSFRQNSIENVIGKFVSFKVLL